MKIGSKLQGKHFMAVLLVMAGTACSPAATVSPASISQPSPTTSPTQIPPTPTLLPTSTPEYLDPGYWSVEESGDTWGIYLVEPSGENLRRLTERGVNYRSPQFSPDGQYIAFVRIYEPVGALLLYNRQSKELQVVAEDSGRYGPPAWSPDSSRVAFTFRRNFGEQSELLVYELGTGDTTTAVEWEGRLSSPTWSPSGEQLAFAGESGEFYDTFPFPDEGGKGYEIYMVNADGSELTQLTSTDGLVRLPSWSPDEDALAYILLTLNSPDESVQLIDPTGPQGQPITLCTTYLVSRPIWSPDGQLVVVGGQTAISVADKATLMCKGGVDGGAGSFVPRAWSDDGEMLLIDAAGCCLEHTGFVRLEEPLVYHFVLGPLLGDQNFWQTEATWTPDADLIAFAGLLNPPVP
jgi:dipeptidyl aminopeptidase/acylaminoacyl peptidase